MSNPATYIIGVQALIWLAMIVGIIVFGVRAYEKRKNQKFEDRDN